MRRLPFKLLFAIAILTGFSTASRIYSAQQPSPDAVPVSIVVSVEARHGKDVPTVEHKEDVRAFQGRERLRVTDWIPLQGDHADLDLLVLVDEATGAAVANQFDDVRKFLQGQPSTTAIGIGYMEYGTVHMLQNFTKDHDAAGKTLRIPLGAFAGGNSPYLSVTDVIKRWPPSKARHSILLVSDGIDPLQPGLTDSYLDQTIEIAQRTGTQVYAIYASRAGHFGHSLWRINQGQNNLSQLTDKTGGESYFQGLDTPVSFAPFLDEFADRLNHQYMLTFLIEPGKKPSFKHVRLETEIPNAELVTADQVYVPASK
jgi:hypothetical protein